MATKKITVLMTLFACSPALAMEELERVLDEQKQQTNTQRALITQSLREAQTDLNRRFSLQQKLTLLETLATPHVATAIPTSPTVPTLITAVVAMNAITLAKTGIPRRFPPVVLAIPTIVSFAKKQGTNIFVAGTTIYFINRAIKAINTMIHAPCKAQEEKIVAEFKKTVDEAIDILRKQFAGLQREVLRQTEQARMNVIDAIVKFDQITEALSTRIESLEKKVAKTDLKKELELFKKELDQQRKNLAQACTKKDSTMTDLRQDFDALQKQFRKMSTQPGAAGPSNDAIATIALQVQKISEDLRRHESGTPAPTPRSCSSTLNLDVPVITAASMITNKGRRASFSGPPPTLIERVTPPSPEPGASGPSATGGTLAAPKPNSPKRRNSCFNLFNRGSSAKPAGKGKGKEKAADKPA